MSTEPLKPAELPPKRRLRRKLLRGCLGSSFVGVTLLAVLLIYMLPGLIDDPPYVAPDLEPVRAPVPQEGNFALFLIGLDGAEEFDDPEELEVSFENAKEEGRLEEFLASEEGAKFLGEYWGPVEKILTEVDAALEMPYCEFPPPPALASDEPLLGLMAVRNIADAWNNRVTLAALESHEAHDEALISLVRFSGRLTEPQNLCVIQTMSHTSVAFLALYLASDWLERADSPTRIRRVAGHLGRIDADPQMVSHALREEFAQIRHLVENFWESETGEEMGAYSRFFLLPERTVASVGDHYRAAIAEGESTGRVTSEIAMNLEPSFRSMLREGNTVGRALVALLLFDTSSLYGKCARLASTLDLTQLQFALRIRELESGSLPNSLDALVPEFFAELPVDPFTQKPYHYDSARRIVWGVGADGNDDGGVTEEDSRSEPDIVREIPGGD